MPEQDLDHPNVDVLFKQMAKLCRSVCGATQLGNPARSAAMWHTRLSWRVVMG